MFNAPSIFTNIPDVAHIYELNEQQGEELDSILETMDNNLFIDKMDIYACSRWEKVLDIVPLDDDTLEDRRFKIKAKMLERLPYSYRVIVQKLDTLCPEGYTFIVDEGRTSAQAKLALKSKKMIKDVSDFIDDVLPLNMTYVVSILWNQYRNFTTLTHEQLKSFTHKELREEVIGD